MYYLNLKNKASIIFKTVLQFSIAVINNEKHELYEVKNRFLFR